MIVLRSFAYFAVMMKARQYDRRLFSREIQPNIYAIHESDSIQNEVVEYFHKNDEKLKKAIESIISEMRDAKRIWFYFECYFC